MYRPLIRLAVISLVVRQYEAKPGAGLLSDEDVFYINHIAQTSWKATNNSKINDYNDIEKLLGVLDMDKSWSLIQDLPEKDHGDFSVDDLPTNYDPRTIWPQCDSLKEIRDQSVCGSCWAFGAVEAISDRICIKSGGKKNVHISAENLITCCKSCGHGCMGGFPSYAWQYYQNTGIVTGGQYGSNQGCQPFVFPKCDHLVPGKYKPCPTGPIYPLTPVCSHECRHGYNKTYKDDLHFGRSTYSVKGVDNIMKELVANGPVEACFLIYSDFINYKSGVYRYTKGPQLGGHCVKIIGYGVEKGDKYWLVANSWNTDWGDKGFFKILRGVNECAIESNVVAGEPKL